jgi:hypothetical protein
MAVSKEKALARFDELIALAEEKRRTATHENRYDDLYHRAVDGGENFVGTLFGDEERKNYWRHVHGGAAGGSGNYALDMELYGRHLGRCITQLEAYKKRVEMEWPDEPEPTKLGTVAILEHLAKRLPIVIHELRQRHANRPTLDVKDEYDLQDLVRSLLYINFEDVRREEGTPSLAGVNGRADFLLYNEKTIVELKMTREGLRNKELKEQLSNDKPHYFKHPDCKTLVAIVYDPGKLITNPRGAETDLSAPYNGMSVNVFIIQG